MNTLVTRGPVVTAAICCLVALSFLAPGCSDSGNSGAGVTTEGSTVQGSFGTGDPTTGGLTFLIRDMPLEGIESFEITIESVEVLGESSKVTLFEGERRVDLLDLQNEEAIIAHDDDFPLGTYEKIRLRMRDPEISPNPDALPIDYHPNGKLDLVPSEPFEVRAGENVFVRADFDVHNSLHVIRTGNERLRVRPVFMVDIVTEIDEALLLEDLTGEVITVNEENDSWSVELDDDAGAIEVCVDDDTVIFDENLDAGTLDTFDEGDRIWIRAVMRDDCVEARVVFFGDPTIVRGVLPDGLEEDASADLEPVDGQDITDTLETSLVMDWQLYREDDGRLDPAPLAEDSVVRAFGRIDDVDGVFHVGLVDLQGMEVQGVIDEILEDDDGALSFTLDLPGDVANATFDVTEDTKFRLAGTAPVGLLDLRTGMIARVIAREIDGGNDVAECVRVTPDERVGSVTAISDGDGEVTIENDEGTEFVLMLVEGVEIILVSDAENTPLELDDLVLDDEVRALGVDLADDGFKAYMLIVTDTEELGGDGTDGDGSDGDGAGGDGGDDSGGDGDGGGDDSP